jgi:hypothetical protein
MWMKTATRTSSICNVVIFVLSAWYAVWDMAADGGFFLGLGPLNL